MNHAAATKSGPKKSSAGYSLIELVMVLMILVMLCATVFTLIYSGQHSYMRINASRESTMNTRDALAYVDMRIRQNDFIYGVSVRECPLTGENALFIQDFMQPGLATWIFFYDGKLYEYYNYDTNEPDIDTSMVIAELDSFTVAMDEQGVISKTATFISEETQKSSTISSSVSVRSVR